MWPRTGTGNPTGPPRRLAGASDVESPYSQAGQIRSLSCLRPREGLELRLWPELVYSGAVNAQDESEELDVAHLEPSVLDRLADAVAARVVARLGAQDARGGHRRLYTVFPSPRLTLLGSINEARIG